MSATETLLEDLIAIVHRLQLHNFNVLDHHLSIGRILLDLKLGSLLDIFREEQVSQLSLVDLDHVAAEVDLVISHPLGEMEQLFNRPWGESRHLWSSLDGEGLSRTCLPISENANVITINSRLNQPLGLIEDLHLRTLRSKH